MPVVKAFYSFHYSQDCWRAATVRSIGAIEGNRPAPDNDWETITKGGDTAIKKWIVDQMKGRSFTVVLIAEKTANRKWITYEIAESWNTALDAADAFGMVQGAGEGVTGTGLLNASLAVTAGTGGASIEITGPGALVGGGLAVHGLFVSSKSAGNLMSQNGRVEIHGNNKSSTNSQHGYEIKDKKTGDVHKYGISGEKLNKNGTSRRANTQVNKLNKAAGADRYSARVVKKNMAGRGKGLNWEKGKVKGYKKANTQNQQPKANILPQVE